jgi:hypothetical protein
MNYQTITITFGEQAVTHIGMETIGEVVEEGFTIADLENAKLILESKGAVCELINLNENLSAETDIAKVLIIRNGVDTILNKISKNKDDLFTELKHLDYDKKAKMYGRVVNKNARYNLCIADYTQEPNYQEGKGRIISFNDIPLTKCIREELGNISNKGENLAAELNNYQDIRKMGIGFHGDAERLKVIAVRIGASLPLHYQWFYKGKSVGERIILELNHGDMYIMSQKATGNDWKKKNIYTLRHATGCEKFTKIK